MNRCSVGDVLEVACHKKTYPSQKQGLVDVSTLGSEEQEVLHIRVLEANLNEGQLETVCIFHKYYYIDKYAKLETKCCNPFKTHKKVIKNSSLRAITLETYRKIKSKNETLRVIPGKKLCANCNIKVMELLEGNDSSCHVSSTDSEIQDAQVLLHADQSLQEVNTSLENLGQSPLKLHGIPSSRKQSYGKRKLDQVNISIRAKVSRALNLNETDMEEKQNIVNKKDEWKIKAFDDMIFRMGKKIHDSNTTRAEKIQILTMAPRNQSREQVCTMFNVSERIVRQARDTEKSSGICSMPLPRKGKSLPADVSKKVIDFYQNNEYSRIMPGMKDRVSIRKNQYEQKRLLLCTLKELYAAFKEENKEIKLGFSKFCTLRPKWCVSAGSSGTHSVCVCTIHQNVVLLLHAAESEECYKDLIRLAVCDLSNKECMLQRCDHCPGMEAIQTMLQEKFEDMDEEIRFKQWVSVDRTDLISQQLPISEFIQLLISKISALIPHHYISNAQSSYLKRKKESMAKNTSLVLMDFAENYSFYIQDEAQGYHWTNKCCTVHPVVCYFKSEENELMHASMCFLSEEMQHDVVMVYFIQKSVMAFLKTKVKDLLNVEYFTDGCAAQYKNCKSFYNLCQHRSDFNVSATWSFFATSHGKSPCDGIGGTVKRSTAMESLRRPLSNQNTDVMSMMDHCTKMLPTITFVCISKEDLDDIKPMLYDRFSKASTIKGTRSFHYFEPISSSKLGMKRISDDTEFSLTVDLQTDRQSLLSDISQNQFVCAVYDHQWYIGMVKETDKDNNDLLVEFMHPSGPARSFRWPQQSDACWVPLQHVLCLIDIPTLATVRGQYHLSNKTKQIITAAWAKFENSMQ